MPSEDLQSPPYPGAGTTIVMLYSMLIQLRDWVVDYRPALNHFAGSALIPEPGPIPPRPVFNNLPVMAHFRSLMFLRKLREQWDHIVRTYEDEWGSPECVRRRVALAAMAAHHLSSAFRPFELREARKQDDLEEMYKVFEQIASTLTNLWEPTYGADPAREDRA